MSISSIVFAWLAQGLAASIACASGPVTANPLIEIAAGPFVFGSDTGVENERPRRVVAGRAFAIHRTEVSNAQYRLFVTATGHRPAFYDSHLSLGLDDRPVVGVSYDDAAAFCAHHGLTLPSEREYERAARGIDGASHPWGAPLAADRVNGGGEICCAGDDGDGYAMTAPVDSFVPGASAEGVLNLIGNVWEWTRDMYAPYEGEPAPGIGDISYRVLRGGAWNSDPAHLSATYRLAYAPDYRFAANGGFRCVRPSE